MSSFSFTDIPLHGRHLIEANAGTGKTFNISRLYVRLILEKGFLPEQILVVTFTEAATAELRERLHARMLEVHHWLNNEFDSDTIKDPALFEFVQQGDTEWYKARITQALAHFDNAAIFTIHGFCQRTLTEFAFETQSPFKREVIHDAEEMVNELMYDVLRGHLAENESDEVYQHLIHPNQVAQTIDTIRTVARILRQHPHLELCDERDPKSTQTELFELLRRFRAYAHSELGTELPLFQKGQEWGKTRSPDIWPALLSQIDACIEQHQITDAFKDALAKWHTSSEGWYEKYEQTDRVKTLVEWTRSLFVLVHAPKRQAIVQMAKSVNLRFEAFTTEQTYLTYDDMILYVYRALTDDRIGSVVAAQLREKYPCGLIDEFQDTDTRQFGIFDAMWKSPDDGFFCMIGDPKQAIYKFRGADIHAYFKARESVPAPHRWTLTGNRRSDHRLVLATAVLFEKPQAFFMPEMSFEEASLEWYEHSLEERALPEFDTAASSLDNAPLQVWEVADTSLNVSKAYELVTSHLIHEIQQLAFVDEDKRPKIGAHPVQPGDIAILVRSKHKAKEVFDALKYHGMDAVIVTESSVLDSVEARDLLFALQAIAQPANLQVLRTFLLSSFCSFSAPQLHQVFENDQEVERLISFFREAHVRAERGFILQSLQHVFSYFNTWSHLASGQNSERAITNLRHLLEIAQKALSEEKLSLNGLEKWLRTKMADDEKNEAWHLRLESDKHLIKIVTIHKSKGLEYPIVFVYSGLEPCRKEKRDTFKNGVIQYYDKDGVPKLRLDGNVSKASDVNSAKLLATLDGVADEIRLYYVALTRAKFRCYLIKMATDAPLKASHSISVPHLLRVGYPQGILNLAQFLSIPTQDASVIGLLPTDGTPIESYANPVLDELVTKQLEHVLETGLSIRKPSSQRELKAAIIKREAYLPSWHSISYSSIKEQKTAQEEEEQRFLEQDSDALYEHSETEDFPFTERSDHPHFNLPKGAHFGNALHGVLEHLDFSTALLPEHQAALADVCRQHLREQGIAEQHTSAFVSLIKHLIGTRLPLAETTLSSLPKNVRKDELEFHFSISPTTRAALFDLLEIPVSSDSPLFVADKGIVKGFIDLLFEHNGKAYIVDYKSDHLGYHKDDYAIDALRERMIEHNYVLQYHLYTLAVHRYLTQLLGSAYDYETHFGGAIYLFARGMDPNTPYSGCFAAIPPKHRIEAMHRLFVEGSAS